MRRWSGRGAGRRIALFGVAAIVAGSAGEARALNLVDIDVERGATATEVRLRFDAPARDVDVVLLPERRLVVDIAGANAGLEPRQLLGDGATVARVRLGEHPGFVRVVLDLLRDSKFSHRFEGNSLIVAITPASGSPVAAAGRAAPPAAPRKLFGTLLPSTAAGLSGTLLPGNDTPPDTPGTLLPGTEAAHGPETLLPGIEAPNRTRTLLPRNYDEPEPGVLLPGQAPLPEPPPAPEGPSASLTEKDDEPESGTQVLGVLLAPAPTEGEDDEEASLPEAAPPRLSPEIAALPLAELPRPASDSQARAERKAARISIEFRDTDVRTILDLVARAGGYQVIFAPEVKGRTGVSAADRPWREVFEDVLRRARLESVEHDDLILVSPAGRH